MSESKPKPRVKLSGENGNAFVIIGKVERALSQNGYSSEVIKEFKEKATDGDYDNLLRVCMEYVNVH
jgi:hypothetical protein